MLFSKKNKKPAIIGFIFGLIAPIFGLFFGLQVSTMLGNIFTFPWILIASITGEAFGYWSGGMKLFAFLFSGAMWSGIFVLIKYFLNQNDSKKA